VPVPEPDKKVCGHERQTTSKPTVFRRSINTGAWHVQLGGFAV
jgi:hypothetical protein